MAGTETKLLLHQVSEPLGLFAAVTSTNSVIELLLAPKLPATPEYVAVMALLPCASEVVQCATLPLRATPPQPEIVLPFAEKATVPVGVPELAVTVAVKVIEALEAELA